MGGGVTRLPIATGLSTRPAVAIDLPTPPLQLDLAYPGGGIKLGLARHARADVPIMLARHDRMPFGGFFILYFLFLFFTKKYIFNLENYRNIPRPPSCRAAATWSPRCRAAGTYL